MFTLVTGEISHTSKTFLNDLDTTSLAYLILEHDEDLILSVMDEMLEYQDEDGIINVGIKIFSTQAKLTGPLGCV